jgi:acetyl-CoA C-acetyltransferase
MPTVITGYARTPIGRFGGGLRPLAAVDLGGVAIAAALARSGVAAGQLDEVLFGHVIQAGAGQITSRQAAVRGGIPMTVPATTINKVCLPHDRHRPGHRTSASARPPSRAGAWSR